MKFSFVGPGLCALSLFACGSEGAPGATGIAGATTGAGGATSSGTTGSSGQGGNLPKEWKQLVSGDWSLESGTEGYVCVRVTVPEDTYIQAFRPIAPVGTHHTVLTRDDVGPDETFDCGAATNGPNMIYGSGVGTGELKMPPGVAVKLEKGTQLLLNLHLFNPTGDALTGFSGVEYAPVAADEVEQLATGVLAGTTQLDIPAQASKTETGYCTMPADVSIFAIGPHMHQYGTHLKVTAETAAGDSVVFDEDYSFDDQRHYPLSPLLQMKAGERIRVDCTYKNTSSANVGFGDSSLQEMCFAGLFTYPASSGLKLVCTQ